MDISFGYPSIYESGDKSLTMYFKASIPVRESHLAYPQSTLFAEIGGYTGLLLGMSAIHLSRFLFKSILKALKAPRRKNKDQYTSQSKDDFKKSIDGIA